ncbi:MAG TPA: Glu/Leu/Phe/Val dehydrogenase dimerization domain-containing protein [Thermoanaerobaculia bacterium]|nr:Glu/Leu/Phe/Val dehydrogenase dimerization domain-containing protein [Thermoanaerobaculia bacterium]
MRQTLFLSDDSSQLRGFLVIDDTSLGPACGGVRIAAYPNLSSALGDCLRLAHAMTIKCALAGLPAGGGKVVVIDHPALDRRRAFRELGARIEAMHGAFRTAGDFGTTCDDLAAMAETTRYVHCSEERLAAAAGRGIVLAASAAARMRGHDSLEGLRVAVQGCGTIGSAAARAFRDAGARLFVSDCDGYRCVTVAHEVGAVAVDADEILELDADILVPCARGGVIDAAMAPRIRAWAVCGGANNIVADDESERTLVERGIVFVPDVVSSAGAVIEGIGESVMGLADRTPLVDAIQETTRSVLARSMQTGELPSHVAESIALARIEGHE